MSVRLSIRVTVMLALAAAGIILLGCGVALAADPWGPVAVPNQNYGGVSFVSANEGWVVGDTGEIIHSTDGGTTWKNQTSNTIDGLHAVDFVDANNGWAVGSLGTIVHTSNGGQTWAAQTSNTADTLNAVSFVDSQDGWAVGTAVVLRTTTGGQTWTADTSLKPNGLGIDGVAFANTTNGWIVTDVPDIRHSTDGGQTWGTPTTAGSNNFLGVCCVDSTHAWAVGWNGTIVATTDGSTWHAQTSGVNVTLFGVTFADQNHGWAVGENGTILATSNGGQTWTPQADTGITNQLDSVCSYGASHGWAVGSAGAVLVYTGAGPSYTAPTVAISGADSAWHGKAVDLTVAATVDPTLTLSHLQYSTDGGATWNEIAGSGLSRSLTLAANGTTTVSVRATDSNSQTATAQATVKIDATTPTIAVAGADAAWHTTPVTLTFTPAAGPSGVAKVEYQLNGGAWTAITQGQAGYALAVSTDGADTIGYRVTSGAGITSTTGTCVIKLATKTPSLSVKPHKVIVAKKARAKLAFSYTWAGSRGIPASLDVMVTTYGHQKTLSTITPVAGGGTQTVTLLWKLPAGHYTLHLRLTDAAGQIVHATAAIVAKR